MMPRHTAASLLCAIATLLLLFSTTASAALVCNAANFMCYEDGNELVAQADACNCCPLGSTTNCTAARSKCTNSFYKCPTSNTYLDESADSCQCCDVSDVCQAAQSKCPTVNDERCIACVDDVCVNCIPGYWTAFGSPCSKCLVANCLECEAADGTKCATCQDKYKLSDGKYCNPNDDGVFGLQSSYIAAAAATLAMALAVVA